MNQLGRVGVGGIGYRQHLVVLLQKLNSYFRKNKKKLKMDGVCKYFQSIFVNSVIVAENNM